MDVTPYIGMKFNKLTILKSADKDNHGNTLIKCLCDCGNEKILTLSAVKRGVIKSCGCGKKAYKESFIKEHITHGHSKTRLYRIYHGMITRCNNPKREDYKHYGGRDIKVCDEWYNNYLAFEKWALSNGYDKSLTIDRIDVNKDYSPDNCKWVTRKEQSRNQERTVYLTYNGEKKPMSEWAELLGISYWTLRSRIKYGWTDKEIIEGKRNMAERVDTE